VTARHSGGRRRLAGAVTFGVVLALVAAGAAFAYFVFNGSTSLPLAVADSIPQGAAPSVALSPTNSTTVIATFTDVAVGATTITDYTLTRYPAAGGAGTAVGSCSDSSHSVSCSDTGVPNGSWKYTYTADLTGTNWTRESLASNAISVSSTAPAVTIDAAQRPTSNTAPTFTGTYGTASGDIASVSVTVYSGPDTSGAVVATPSATLDTTNHTWSTAPLSPALSTDGTYTVAARQSNTGGSTGTSTTSFVLDTTGPTTPAPTVTAAVFYGASPLYVDNESVTLTDSPSDADSGVYSVSYYYCASAVTTCTSSNGTLIGSSTTAAGGFAVSSASPLASPDGTYKVVAVATDSVQNSTTSSSTLIYVDTTPPTVARPTVNGHS
jgi:hypothetical protein